MPRQQISKEKNMVFFYYTILLHGDTRTNFAKLFDLLLLDSLQFKDAYGKIRRLKSYNQRGN